jgi:alpha-tubulin suppressor-like RCC1 family protein
MAIDNIDTPAGITDLDTEYEILGELGRGGMAVVYLARDRQLGRDVAIKVIRAQFVEDEEAMRRFAREARTVAQLHHPNIVAIHAIKQLADGSLALVMHHVPGRTLKEAIRQDGPLPIETAEHVLTDLGAALAFSHSRGIVHRDVKPENVLLEDETGRALLFDFGIARSTDNHTHLTLTGMALGTPAYMSPEQIDGAEVDGRSDLYSLGLVGWEMLTGVRPWDSEGLYTVIFKQKNEYLPPLDQLRPETPERVQLGIEGALQKERDNRWARAEDFLAQLSQGTEGTKRWRSSKRHRQQVIAAVAATREQEQVAVADAPTIRYRRPGVAPAPSRDARKFPRSVPFGIIAVLLLVFGASAVIYAGIGGRADEAGATAAPAAVAGDAQATGTPADDQLAYSGAELESLIPLGSAASASVLVADSAAAISSEVTPPVSSAVDTGAAGKADSSVPTPDAAARGTTPPEASTSPAPAPPAREPEAAPSAPPPADAGGGTVVTGGMHSCVLTPAGEGFCWGGNERGQLGNGSTARRPEPARIAGDMAFRSMSAGGSHTCGVARNGEAYCWGGNDSGQLGDGSSSPRAAPVRVAGTRRFSRVWTGMSHTCGVTSGGEAYCWGANGEGQLGDGTSADKSSPAKVAAATSFETIAVGWQHTCALGRNGRAYCWGANSSGQLGDGSTMQASSPAPVGGSQRFTRLVAGSAHTCGIVADGGAMCWGRNSSGQLGDGSTADRGTPTPVQHSGSGFVNITAGSAHTCALARGGVAYCWGRNSYGQLGEGSTTDRLVPVKVTGGHIFTSIAASGAHTCGTTTAGDRLCWGYNVEGQLGDGTRSNRTEPVRSRS